MCKKNLGFIDDNISTIEKMIWSSKGYLKNVISLCPTLNMDSK